MRLTRGLLLFAAFAVPSAGEARANRNGDQGAIVTVRANVQEELADGYVDSNPCESTPPYSVFSFQATGHAKAGSVTYTYDAMSDLTPESHDARWFASGGDYADFYGVIDLATFDTVTVTHRSYLVGCRDPLTGDVDAATVGLVWVPVVSEVTVIPAVMAEVVEVVPAPEVFFPVADARFGWLYVNTPMEVRVANLEAVSVSVVVANAVSSASGSATAVPVRVVFESGEPGGGAVVCSVGSVQVGWDRGDPDGSGCVYRYANSSAITQSAQFQARTVVDWHVTGTGGLDMTIQTLAFDYVSVAEAQAVVVAP